MGSLFPCFASEKMWENFKLGKILENRNKNVKWNTVNISSSSPPHTHSQYLYKCSDSRTSIHTNTHWCREHKENCLRINYFYTFFQISFLNWGFNEIFFKKIIKKHIFWPRPIWGCFGPFWTELEKKKTRDGHKCSRADGCTLHSCELDASAPPLEAQACFPRID